MKHHRLARVAEAIREAASEAILFNLKDPRIKFTTVTRAEVSADLQHAKVYVSVMGSERDQNLTLHGLKSATGFIQSKVGERMKSRYVPHLQFVLDEGARNAQEVARLLAEEKTHQEPEAIEGDVKPETED
jgi:ribosome-binding factor A